MSVPALTARGTPAGNFLSDGFSTKLAIAALPTVSFWEKEVQPPGIDGGEPIDTSTMHNLAWRTFVSRSLMTLTPFTLKAAYDPNVFATSQIQSLINREGAMTISFPDGSTLSFFAFTQKMEPEANVEGTFPTVSITICPTNYDPVAHVEAAPAYVNVSGT